MFVSKLAEALLLEYPLNEAVGVLPADASVEPPHRKFAEGDLANAALSVDTDHLRDLGVREQRLVDLARAQSHCWRRLATKKGGPTTGMLTSELANKACA